MHAEKRLFFGCEFLAAMWVVECQPIRLMAFGPLCPVCLSSCDERDVCADCLPIFVPSVLITDFGTREGRREEGIRLRVRVTTDPGTTTNKPRRPAVVDLSLQYVVLYA